MADLFAVSGMLSLVVTRWLKAATTYLRGDYMIYRKLDEDDDYTFGRNQNNYISGAAAVNQAVVTRLRQLIYEWWEDLEDGIPVWQKILGNRDKQEAERIIRERILKTKYVKSLLAFEVIWDNKKRTFTIQASVDTEFGQIEINEVI